MKNLVLLLLISKFSFGAAAPVEFSSATDLEVSKLHTLVDFTIKSYGDAVHGEGRVLHNETVDFNGIEWVRYFFNGVTGHMLEEQTHNMGSISNNPDFGIIIALHGSYFLSDWVTDLDCGLIDSHSNGLSGVHGKVHRGFMKAIESASENFTTAFNRLLEEFPDISGSEFFVCGHSLAGGLAKLLALKFLNYGFVDLRENQLKVITFSSPRIGDKELVRNAESLLKKHNVINFYGVGDVVPGLAPDWMGYSSGIGYHIPIPHTSTEVMLSNEIIKKFFGGGIYGQIEAAGELAGLRGNPALVLSWAHRFHEGAVKKAFLEFQVKHMSGSSCVDDLPSVFSPPRNSWITNIYMALFG